MHKVGWVGHAWPRSSSVPSYPSIARWRHFPTDRGGKGEKKGRGLSSARSPFPAQFPGFEKSSRAHIFSESNSVASGRFGAGALDRSSLEAEQPGAEKKTGSIGRDRKYGNSKRPFSGSVLPPSFLPSLFFPSFPSLSDDCRLHSAAWQGRSKAVPPRPFGAAWDRRPVSLAVPLLARPNS